MLNKFVFILHLGCRCKALVQVTESTVAKIKYKEQNNKDKMPPLFCVQNYYK